MERDLRSVLILNHGESTKTIHGSCPVSPGQGLKHKGWAWWPRVLTEAASISPASSGAARLTWGRECHLEPPTVCKIPLSARSQCCWPLGRTAGSPNHQMHPAFWTPKQGRPPKEYTEEFPFPHARWGRGGNRWETGSQGLSGRGLFVRGRSQLACLGCTHAPTRSVAHSGSPAQATKASCCSTWLPDLTPGSPIAGLPGVRGLAAKWSNICNIYRYSRGSSV